MKIGKGLIAGLLLLLMAAEAQANDQIIPLSTEGGSLRLLSQDSDALHYRVDLDALHTREVMTPRGAFTRLSLPGLHRSQEVGAPELPMINRLVEIPYGAGASVEILSAQTREIDLAQLGLDSPLYPAQPSMPKSADPANWPFVHHPDAYRAEPVARELVRVEPLGRLRGVGLGRVEISPVAWYPSEKRLVVTESLEFRVTFSGGDIFREAELKALTRSTFFDPVYDQVDGYRGLHDSYPDRVRDLVTMVVVSPPEFEYQLADFVDWKTERGFLTILAVTGTPDVGTTKEQIRDYIHGLYNDATPEQPAPSFVLFVGDTGNMPTWNEGGNVTDRPYCDVEGDLVPDIFYGRFSATNPTQLQNMLDKTLMYDQYAMPDPSYLHEVVMIAGMDSGHGSTWGNGQINYGTTYYFNADHDIYSHTYLYPESGSHASDIVQNVSDGVSYINYTAHGSSTSWSDPYFGQNDINNLQNYGKYCLAVGNCCTTSDYSVGECFAETWLRAQEKGAIGYIGGSDSTYWDEDYWWGVGSGQIVSNPTYETHGLGAYDGVFHDHGEAMTQWYVTNDALIFSGNIAVMEAGSGMIGYYWTIYNLMGDPSLTTWIGTPGTNPVTHAETLFTTSSSLTIEAAPNSYCGLTMDGVLVGAGTVDETGVLDLAIWDVLTPGSAHLVVMAQFREPYVTDINVIVPATIDIDPSVIDANTPTTVSVGVFESDGITPMPGIDIWAEGLDYSTPASVTGPDGYCELDITYSYGPSLDICGQDPAEPWLLFRQALEVNADPLPGIALRVTTDIGLTNAFALNLPGTLEAFRPMGGGELPAHELWGFVNGDPGLMTTEDSMTLTPTELGEVLGVFAVSGYDLIEATFPIIEAYGTLTGHIYAEGSPASGALLQGWDNAMELAFEATAGPDGAYDVGEDILVADYTLTVALFGYLPHAQPYFVNYGANVLDVDLAAAPAGIMSGTITEFGTGTPLEGTVKVYRSDNGELYDETTSDGLTGQYATGALPYFDYDVVVHAWHHIPVTATVTIDEPTVERHWVLEQTIGAILIIDDTARGPLAPDDLLGKGDSPFSEEDYLASEPKAVTDIVNDLEYLGYTVAVETVGATDAGTWMNYDLLMSCSGANITTLNSSAIRNALIAFVQDGGRLLIEGGEVGYDHYGSGTFASVVLHINDWDGDSSGSVTVSAPTHPVMSVPNEITGPIDVAYSDWGDEDALDQTSDATRVGSWTEATGNASVICYDDDDAPENGQIVFFCWNYAAMDASARPLLLQNAINWLLATTTAVEDAPEETLPTRLALGGNYPNPFNPRTSIRFELPEAARVELAVYDVKGRRVDTLISEQLEAGRHEAIWQGCDEAGRPAASGLYFARLISGEEVLTRKMLLLK